MTNIHFNLQPNAPEPLYLQFKNQLKKAIQSEEIPPGTQLPDLRTLADMANVSIRTAYRGMDELIKAGICQKRPKKGTFVADVQWDQPDKRRLLCGYMLPCSEEAVKKDHMLSQMLQGIQDATKEHNIDLIQISGSPIEALECYEENKKLNFLGMIAFDSVTFRSLAHLADLFPDKRFVLLNFNYDAFDCSPKNLLGVFNDDFSGGRNTRPGCVIGEIIKRMSRHKMTFSFVSLELFF